LKRDFELIRGLLTKAKVAALGVVVGDVVSDWQVAARGERLLRATRRASVLTASGMAYGLRYLRQRRKQA
jgi:hypothetical protein